MKMTVPKIACLLALTGWMEVLQAATVAVPNGSFESPRTDYVDVNIDFWQKSARPDWYVESGGYLWTQLTGVFKNTPTNSPAGDHIDNCDGDQALWLFAVPEVALFQDYDSMDWNDSAPTHAFDAKFQVGKSYDLTVGIIGTGGGMLQGVTLELSLYYRNAASNMVAVAVTSVTNTSEVFSNNTHLIDFHVRVPPVKATDAWAGQNIGVQFASTVSSNLQGGYWDLDNVRLAEFVQTEFVPPAMLNPVWSNGQFQFTVQSEPGIKLEILATTNLSVPISSWTSVRTFTNTTGIISFTDAPDFDHRFYQTRLIP